MQLDGFLTEYDQSVGSDLNVDPLGLLVIWSAFGQRIFRNLLSSNANDVRNYTINLFNHWFVRGLIEDETVVLRTALTTRYPRKDDLNFKQACLVYLENLFTLSLLAHRDEIAGIQSVGVLGISKAGRLWADHGDQVSLTFSHEDKAFVLARQNVLGISGRYKTPLLQMGFFDRHYAYTLPESAALWDKTRALVETTPVLRTLAGSLKRHFRELLASRTGEPAIRFAELPGELTRAFVRAYASPAFVGRYAKAFWLGVTKLDQGAAGSLYGALVAARPTPDAEWPAAETVFEDAARREPDPQEREKLQDVRRLEPFLGEVDLLFTLMLSEAGQSMDDVVAQWHDLGRDEHTLSSHTRAFAASPPMLQVLSGTGLRRMTALMQIAEQQSVHDQASDLLAYHDAVMNGRGQASWIKRSAGNRLRLDVPTRRAPSSNDRRPGTWVHNYYIPQFINLINGLQGAAP
jgi:hypothetical protein